MLQIGIRPRVEASWRSWMGRQMRIGSTWCTEYSRPGLLSFLSYRPLPEAYRAVAFFAGLMQER
jgi:hypothetical protein